MNFCAVRTLVRPWVIKDLRRFSTSKSIAGFKDGEGYFSAIIGANEPREDRSDIHEVPDGALFAVFDGHGGYRCAEYCGQELLKFTAEYMSKGMSPDEVKCCSNLTN